MRPESVNLGAEAGRRDVSVAALDLFGGKGLRYKDLVAWNRRRA
jgi:hypothetical protein